MIDTRTATVTTPSEREIVITRTFDAPRATVFEAWTRPEHVKHWWDPAGAALAVCEIDLRPNGAFRFVNRDAAGGDHAFAGIYREISAPARLVFSARAGDAGPETVGTLIFDEKGRQTTLTITIACASRADRDFLLQLKVDAGTVRTLENLDGYLGGRASDTMIRA